MKEVKRKSICDNCIHWNSRVDDVDNKEYEYCNLTYDTEKLKYKTDCNDYEE